MHNQREDSGMFRRGALFSVRCFLPIAAFAIGLAVTSASQAAGTVVNVSLWDKGADTPMATDLGFPATGKDMSQATMGIAVSQDSDKAGETTLEVLNSSEDTIHEMIIARLKDLTQIFPYSENESRVEEDRIEDLGEVSELDPGARGALRLDLKPGSYLLFCNIPGHFRAGMWTVFTVTS
jgi:uncharacterized cupredoxin-like copper-binding protein